MVIQKLFAACFIAILNHEAVNKKIPIETVLRSSFGHNTPSVSITGNSFRINVGLIPSCYAKLMGKALHKLNRAINNINDKTSSTPKTQLNELHKQIKKYNTVKLIEALNKTDKGQKNLEKDMTA